MYGKKVREVRIPMGLRGRSIYAGPYAQIPDGMLGVKMAKEINMPCAVNIPTKDFSVPPYDDMFKGLSQTLMLLAKGEPVYVGCMGGIGRTGLFLAVLGKALGIHDPVPWVRAVYIPHAVETQAQQDYVNSFPVDFISKEIKKAKLVATLKFWVK